MVARIWHGYTHPSKADLYESLLRNEIFHGIEQRKINGFKGIQLLRRPLADEVEFITIMWFEHIDAVKQFAGEDHEKAVVPPEAQQLLNHYDQTSQHYEVLENLSYQQLNRL